ncbi:hypothetical protein EDF24_1194 [Curtobacterium sp. PhB130]|uniref:hypothetical protein n=1 Tax=Curtobacterium sp. PhB130 TaxID=2485178 RepID=UPI000F4B0825|nr:hypothetical protein [Curtobacterium sp. PhB130]ROS75625.1 hypothetical protein EDF24_1194 [Curtobacterium sp. PhB130]
MVLVLSAAAGIVFGVASARASRGVGTLLASAPFLAWFVALAVVAAAGTTDSGMRALGLAMLGILLGLFAGQALVRRRRRSRRR